MGDDLGSGCVRNLEWVIMLIVIHIRGEQQ